MKAAAVVVRRTVNAVSRGKESQSQRRRQRRRLLSYTTSVSCCARQGKATCCSFSRINQWTCAATSVRVNANWFINYGAFCITLSATFSERRQGKREGASGGMEQIRDQNVRSCSRHASCPFSPISSDRSLSVLLLEVASLPSNCAPM